MDDRRDFESMSRRDVLRGAAALAGVGALGAVMPAWAQANKRRLPSSSGGTRTVVALSAIKPSRPAVTSIFTRSPALI